MIKVATAKRAAAGGVTVDSTVVEVRVVASAAAPVAAVVVAARVAPRVVAVTVVEREAVTAAAVGAVSKLGCRTDQKSAAAPYSGRLDCCGTRTDCRGCSRGL